MTIKTPKFRVNDIVTYRNDFSYNEACKVVCVGRIVSVNIFTGPGIFTDPDQDTTGMITYCVTGTGVDMNEDDLAAFDTMHDLMAEINGTKVEPSPLQLECGKRYRSNGSSPKIVTISDRKSFNSVYPFIGIETGILYAVDGQYSIDGQFSSYNLIEEVTTEKENT